MRIRFYVLSISIFFLFGLLIYQFYTLQIIEGEKWQKVADGQHFFHVQEPFLRGTFYSSGQTRKNHHDKPEQLVIDVEKFHLYLDPLSIDAKYKDTVVDHLADFLSSTPERKEIIKKEIYKRSRSRKIASWMNKEIKEAILSWWYSFAKKRKIARNALYFASDHMRSYPMGKMLGQVLHTIQYKKDEVTKQGFPTGGLELYFNSFLQGHLGKRKLMRSPINAFEIGEMTLEPQNGADVYLTIDPTLQAICEEEIAKATKQFNAKGGWVTLMDPYTGAILAMAQYPFFYPTDYPLYFQDKEKIELTRVKAIQDAQEPGSNMKPFTIACALLANQELKARGLPLLFDPEEKVPCSDGRFPGRRKPITDTRLHKYLNMEMAIQKSSNIYLGRLVDKIIERMGVEWYRDVLIHVFGFGKKTGIELPAESFGQVPKPGKKHPNGTLEWSKATPYSIAMGHNILTTNIQLLRAYAVLANGGYLVEPTLIHKIARYRGSSEEILVNYTTRELQQFSHVLSEEVCQPVVNTIKYSTKPGGTARKADVPGYTEAGKTSTPKKVVNGKYSEKDYCPSFIGFTPCKNPAFVAIVTLDEPYYGYRPGIGLNHHGGACCAPTFRQIAKRALDYLGRRPDDPFGYSQGDPRRDSEKCDWAKEVLTLQEKYDSWNSN